MNPTIVIFTSLLALICLSPGQQPPLITSSSPPPYVQSSTWKVNANKLRQLAYLPECNVIFRIGDIGGLGLDTITQRCTDPAARVAILEKELTRDGSDAEKCVELAGLYYYAGDRRWEQVSATAAQLLKERMKAEPANGRLHALYVTASMRKPAEAFAAAQEAVRLAPQDWQCWSALAFAYSNNILPLLFGSEERVPWAKSRPDLFMELAAHPPSPEHITAAEKCLVLAHECADKALATGHDDPEAYRAHIVAQLATLSWRRWFNGLQGLPPADNSKEFLKTNPSY